MIAPGYYNAGDGRLLHVRLTPAGGTRARVLFGAVVGPWRDIEDGVELALLENVSVGFLEVRDSGTDFEFSITRAGESHVREILGGLREVDR